MERGKKMKMQIMTIQLPPFLSLIETSPFVPFPCNAFCRLACTGSLPHSLNATTELKITLFTLTQQPHPKKNISRINLAFSGNFQQFLKRHQHRPLLSWKKIYSVEIILLAVQFKTYLNHVFFPNPKDVNVQHLGKGYINIQEP